ncbi:mannanase [Cyathus striatus]|nr:mannanase [Cyathus striatus]
MKLASFIALALVTSSIFAAVPLWGQCGGLNCFGETSCISGAACIYQNDWYSQCLASSGTSVSATSTSSTKISSSIVASSTSSISVPAPTGFVGVSGKQLTLNGSKYTVVGGNSYWVGLGGYSEDNMNQAFADIAAAGGTTVRTWGFNEVTSASGIYYQSWSGSIPTINTGSDGLQNFDKVVAAAKANGIRLIVALSDYGGMDVYVNQIVGNGKGHDLFYTDTNVKVAFKNYIKTFVGRYVDEPTILGWELANEPRCKGSTGVTTGTCTPAIVTAWAKEISAYIKSIDSNHLVALGDEGFYNDPSAPTYPYQGSEGIDFDVNLGISTLDFGTVHAYPESWGQGSNITAWGSQWIIDHATSQDRVGKPVILEEYGVTADKVAVYQEWHSAILSSGLAGSLYWQAGSRFSSGSTHDDGYTVYPDSPAYAVFTSYAASLKARKP